MTANPLRFTLFFIATCALASCAGAQIKPETACPSAQTLKAEQLYGRWTARFIPAPAGLPDHATLLLKRHAEFSESLSGTVSRDMAGVAGSKDTPAQAALAGDLEEGMLLLDESSDRISITGTWNGELVAGSCGTLFRGTWKDTSRSAPENAPDLAFTLTRLP